VNIRSATVYFCQEFKIGESEHCGVCSVPLLRQISAKEKPMKRALFAAAAAAAIAVGAIAGSVTSASAQHRGGGGGGMGGAHIGGMGGGAGIRGGGFAGMGGAGPAFSRPGGTVGMAPQRFSGPQRFAGPTNIRTAQAFSGNWFFDRRHHFRRGAFFGFAAGFPYWDYGYSDSCWAWNGVEWVYTCYPYPYY
jgi:hypothetical protein